MNTFPLVLYITEKRATNDVVVTVADMHTWVFLLVPARAMAICM